MVESLMADEQVKVTADITMVLAEAHKDKSPPELLTLFDEEVERFSKFMENLGDWRAQGALSIPEKVLIKTFLVHKFRERF